MNEQEKFWAGQFGREYTARNRVDWTKRIDFWRHVVQYARPQSILEVGCNAGWNLLAIKKAFVMPPELKGIDLNSDAVCEAVDFGLDVAEMSVAEIGMLWSQRFDLVFTSGVLIHIAPDNLEHAMQSIINASKQYVLAIEYSGQSEEAVDYRGHSERLWRRPYGMLYQQRGLRLLEQGVLPPNQGFDNCTYWMLEK